MRACESIIRFLTSQIFMHCTIIAQQIQFIHANHSHRWKYVKCERKSPKNVAMSLTDTKWEREGKNWLITFVNQFVSISYSTLFAILPHISRNKSHDSQSDQAFNSWRCQIDCENKSDKQCYNGWISNGLFYLRLWRWSHDKFRQQKGILVLSDWK